MSEHIGVLQLIKTIGEDKVEMQPLAPAITNLNRKKSYNEVTFATEQDFDLDGTTKLGIVLWFSKEDFRAAKEKLGV